MSGWGILNGRNWLNLRNSDNRQIIPRQFLICNMGIK